MREIISPIKFLCTASGLIIKNVLSIVGGKFMTVPQSLAEEHYAEHTDKPFYKHLISFIKCEK
jgi:nucleoside diphosphate kinase